MTPEQMIEIVEHIRERLARKLEDDVGEVTKEQFEADMELLPGGFKAGVAQTVLGINEHLDYVPCELTDVLESLITLIVKNRVAHAKAMIELSKEIAQLRAKIQSFEPEEKSHD